MASTLPTAEHAADEAGGEVIYSSDAPAPVVVKPPPVPTTKMEDADTILDTGESTHEGAFDAFRSPFASETPMQRLNRLNREVTQLEHDLGDDTSEELQTLATELKARLDKVASLRSREQEDLSKRIQEAISKEPKESSSQATADSAVSSSWDARLQKVEKLVGSGSGGNLSLMARLEEMEGFVKRLDEKALEEASRKAKVIRADLEAASKARNKLSSRKDDSKMIVGLHTQMMELEGLSAHLPALVARLQQLANLHAQSASFGSRLAQTEKEVGQLHSSLQHFEEALEKAETGMAENLKIVQENIQKLDERLGK